MFQYRDERGVLSVFEELNGVPFRIRRAYCLAEVPDGASRGGHAHKAIDQLFIAISGSFELVLDDGVRSRSFVLDSSDRGVHVTPGIWRDLHSFTSDAVCLVLASEPYDEDDYIRDYSAFQEYVAGGK